MSAADARLKEKTEEREAFFAQFEDVIRSAGKLKKVMLKKGLKRARAECPRCGSWLHGRIAGPRNHLHMACEGKCGMSMME